MSPASANEVLDFWFGDYARARWFAKDSVFDDEIRSRFGSAMTDAARGDLDTWAVDAGAALALVVVLDQFPRNAYRGKPAAFASDGKAREIAGLAIQRELDLATPLDRRGFFYLPFEHGEALADQERAVALFTRLVADSPAGDRAAADEELTYAVRHHDIIRRFGRFPHRNAVLGRVSTPEELAFLAGPGSSF